MKKPLIIASYLLLLFALLICFDYFYAKHVFDEWTNSVYTTPEQKEYAAPFKYGFFPLKFKNYWLRDDDFYGFARRFIPEDESIQKPPIIIFGCSFAYGAFLEFEQTFGHKLSSLTGRKVYNRAYCGLGPATMVWQTKSKDFYKFIDNDSSSAPEYAFYVYIPGHISRIYADKYGGPVYSKLQLGYDIKKNGMKESNSPVIFLCNHFNFVKLPFQNKIYDKHFSNGDARSEFEILRAHFVEAKKELQKRYPDIKFIVIKYPMICNIEEDIECRIYVSDFWDELKDDGITVYDLKKEPNVDLTSDKYKFPDGHPNEEAWNVITPKLVKDLNL